MAWEGVSMLRRFIILAITGTYSIEGGIRKFQQMEECKTSNLYVGRSMVNGERKFS